MRSTINKRPWNGLKEKFEAQTSRVSPACRMALAIALWLAASGCGTPGGGRGAVDELHLLTIPVAINFDGMPGADGFAVKVYASRREEPKPVAIPSGIVEILMFDGVVSVSDVAKTPPLRTWTFDKAALSERRYRTSIGVGYQFSLRWDEAKPTTERITVLARYRSPDGRMISSLPSSIAANIR